MNKIEFGDCRETMRRWIAEGVRVQTCVTSPPYFGLRDYGHEGQIGLEQTPEQYITAMVEVFRCVKDVLADDGTLWLNIGDSYCSTAPGTKNAPQTKGSKTEAAQWANVRPPTPVGMKPKDLIGIPWMLAFALRADGWYLRQDIIWHKPNPMPESVRDRCTKAHEYIFLLSKSDKYFFDADAIREPWEGEAAKAVAMGTKEVGQRGINASARRGLTEGQATQFKKQGHSGYFGADGKCLLNPKGANKRSVWKVATKPYKGAHFATFPTELIEPCILAGSRQNDIVLDPFMGSGTTAQVAIQHGRQYLGCELNPTYKELQEERIQTQIKPKKVSAVERCKKTIDLFGIHG
jgi:DNA modification methylase